MSKRNKKTSKPNIAPAALVRVRLERLWLNPAADQTPAAQAQAEREAALQAATRGLKPEVVVEGVLGVFQSAPPATQAQLEPWLPHWLASQNAVEALERLLKAGRLAEALRPIGTRWLGTLGREVATVVLTGASAFYKAWDLDNASQAAVTLLWYSNVHKNRVTGLQFLIDHNPPWEGAVKDVLQFPNKTPEVLERTILEMEQQVSTTLVEIDAATVKRKLLVALKQNEATEIRLPKDLVARRQLFADYVLSLPDATDTPAFNMDDFDALSHTGRSPEDLSLFEQTVGGRMRLPNGQEVFIGSLGDDELSDWDDADDLDDADDSDDTDDADDLEDSDDAPIRLE